MRKYNLVSVEERLSNSEQGEEIKLHRASILQTLKEQNSYFKVIFGSKSPWHSNSNFKFRRVKSLCLIQKSYVQVFKRIMTMFARTSNQKIGQRDKELYNPKSYLQVSRATGFRSSARLSRFKGSLKEQKSNKN